LGIDELAPGALGDRAGVARVLLDLRDGLLPNELDLACGECRVHNRVRHELEQHIEIAAEGLRAEGGRMRSNIEPRGGTDPIEGVGPRLRVARGCATEHGQRAQAADSRTAERLEPLPRLDGEEHGGGEEPRYRYRGDAQAVLEALPADVHQDGSGTNQPTTRPFSWNTDSATVVAGPVSTSARYSRDERPDAASPPPAVAPPSATASAERAGARGSLARGALWPI